MFPASGVGATPPVVINDAKSALASIESGSSPTGTTVNSSKAGGCSGMASSRGRISPSHSGGRSVFGRTILSSAVIPLTGCIHSKPFHVPPDAAHWASGDKVVCTFGSKPLPPVPSPPPPPALLPLPSPPVSAKGTILPSGS